MAISPSAFPRRHTIPIVGSGPLTLNGGASSTATTAANVTTEGVNCSNFRKIGFGYRVEAVSGANGVGFNVETAAEFGGDFYQTRAALTGVGPVHTYNMPHVATSFRMHIFEVTGPIMRVKLSGKAGARFKVDSARWFGIS